MTEAAPAAETPQDSGPDMSGLASAISETRRELDGSPPPQEKPTPAEKPVAKPAADPSKAKKPWDTKVEEPAAEPEPEANPAEKPAATEDAMPKGMKPEAQVRWKDLRKIEDEYKAIKPEYEKLKKELDEVRSKPPQAPPEVEAELNELRQFRAAHDVENTPEFQEAVVTPLQEQFDRLQNVADYAKIDYDALVKATDEINPLMRGKAIRNLLASSSEEVDEAVIQEAVDAAKALHPLYKKGQELKDKALEIKNALTGKEKVQTEAQKAEQQRAYQKASQELHGTLAANFKATGLFDAPELSDAVLKAAQADVREDPQMAAYQAQAGVILPALMEKYQEQLNRNAELERIVKARGKANPALSSRTEAPAQMDEDPQKSLNAAIRQTIFPN